jgi:hypothetical protein
MHPPAPRRPLRILVLSGALLLAAPPAFAQAAASGGFKGQGAVLCIAAGEFLTARRVADPGVPEGLLAWRQVLHVIEGTEERRQAALDSARAAMAPLGEVRIGRETLGAPALWAACGRREFQVRYMSEHGSEDRIRDNLAEEPGTTLDPEAVRRLNVSVSCIAAAEIFSRRRPSRPLRDALRAATLPIPDADGLAAILARARRDVGAAPGSTVGKALAVDYMRSIYDGASSGNDPQGFVNYMSLLLRDHCSPAGSPAPAP